MGVIDGLIPAGLGIVGGLAQTLFSGKRKAEKNLENIANGYQPNNSILDYYNQARNKYSANPYASIGYQNATNNINRNLATGINATQDKRGGLATIGGLVAGADTQDAQAAATADAQSNQALHTLGAATQMKAAEDYKPFEMKYNLAALKAGAANQQQSAGLSNIFSGLSNASNYLNAYENGTAGIGTGGVKKPKIGKKGGG